VILHLRILASVAKLQYHKRGMTSSYLHEEMDGQSIPPKFAQLKRSIMLAAITLLDAREKQAETTFGTLDQYGSDVEFLNNYPFPPSVGASLECDLISIVRMVIGRFVYKRILETPFMGYEPFMELIEDALKQGYDTQSRCPFIGSKA
jgi:hypothetical protein